MKPLRTALVVLSLSLAALVGHRVDVARAPAQAAASTYAAQYGYLSPGNLAAEAPRGILGQLLGPRPQAWAPSWVHVPVFGATRLQTQTFSNTGGSTWVVPPGITAGLASR